MLANYKDSRCNKMNSSNFIKTEILSKSTEPYMPFTKAHTNKRRTRETKYLQPRIDILL